MFLLTFSFQTNHLPDDLKRPFDEHFFCLRHYSRYLQQEPLFALPISIPELRAWQFASWFKKKKKNPPASFAVSQYHVTKFWPMRCEWKVLTSRSYPQKEMNTSSRFPASCGLECGSGGKLSQQKGTQTRGAYATGWCSLGSQHIVTRFLDYQVRQRQASLETPCILQLFYSECSH